ncbi:MAG TPA: hypothetical protein VD710_06020 [Nitrososphaeraceae archaeon]|nr:hypothetical protein [Nitrososphaeraceae archaeon]
MVSKSYFIFAATVTFTLICTPTISSAQWPITEQPSLEHQDLNEQSGFVGNSNQTLPSGNPNSTYSNSTP